MNINAYSIEQELEFADIFNKVDTCPKQSCTVYFKKKPKKQYKGIGNE